MAGMLTDQYMPGWMTNTQASILAEDQGMKYGQMFSSAYNQAQQGQQQTALLQQKQEFQQKNADRVAAKLAPIATAFQGVDSPAAAWDVVSKNPTWLIDPDTSKPVSSFLKTQASVAAAEVGSIEGKSKIAATTDFTKRKSLLDPEHRAAIDNLPRQKDGTPSADQWNLLNLGETVLITRKEAEKKTAAAEAIARGDQQTTTVTDKGVTERFTPSTDASKNPVQLQEQTIGQDKFAVNPKTGHAVKLSQPDKPLGVSELLREKRAAVKDGDDGAVKWIQGFVMDKYPNNAKLFGITNAPAKATSPKANTSSAPNKVRKYNPATDSFE